MDQHLTAALLQLDCTPKEIRLFLASYKQGVATLSVLTKKARLQRSTSYLLVDQLVKKQLLISDSSAYAKQFTAATPDTLIRLLEAKKRRIGRSSLTITDNIDELRQLHNSTDTLPRISTHRGVAGLQTAQRQILGATGEILLWTNQATERSIFTKTAHDLFVRERVDKNISTRVLAIDNPDGRALFARDKPSLRTTRILPSSATFSAETYVFDNHVVILDFSADIIAVIIENSSIAQAHRAMFELAWKTSASYRDIMNT